MAGYRTGLMLEAMEKMNINTNTQAWRVLENQIQILSLVEERIQDLRTLLDEDWRMRSAIGTEYRDQSFLIQ